MNLKILVALVRKNILETWTFGWFLYVPLFAMSLADAWFRFFDGWISFFAVMMMVLYMPAQVMLGAFFGDIRKDWHKFLDYLPVRRSERWLSRYIDGLFGYILLVVALFWFRILTVDLPADTLEGKLLPSGSDLAVFLAALAFWGISCGAFFGFCLTPNALFNTLLGTVPVTLFFGGVTWTAIHHLVLPVTELAPILFGSGVILTACSYVLFVLLPWQWSPARKWLAGATPLFLLTAGATGWMTLSSVETWQKWSEDKGGLVLGMSIQDIPGRGKYAIIKAAQLPSGVHQFSTPASADKVYYLGRGLIEAPFSDSGGRLVFRRWGDLLKSGSQEAEIPYVTMEPTGENSETLRLKSTAESGSTRNYLGAGSMSDCGKYVCYSEHTDEKTRLMITNSSGSPLKAIKCDGLVDYRFARDGMLLASLSENDDGETSEAIQSPTYFMVDCRSLEETRFKLPGQLLCYSPDLSRAVCWKRRFADGRVYSSVLHVDVPGLTSRILLGEEEFPSLEVQRGMALSDSGGLTFADDSEDAHGYMPDGHQPFLRFDRTLSRAVWVRQRPEDDVLHRAIFSIDLATGSRSEIVAEEKLPKKEIVFRRDSKTSTLLIHGLTWDAAAVRYAVENQHYLADLSGGEPRQFLALSRPPDLAGNDAPKRFVVPQTLFSPSGRRMAQYTSVIRSSESELGLLSRLPWLSAYGRGVVASSVEVSDCDTSGTIFVSGEEIRAAGWLDDRRIAIALPSRVIVLDADTKAQHQIFPPTTKRIEPGK